MGAIYASCQAYVGHVTGTPGTGMDVPNLPRCPLPALMSYRTYRSVWYRYPYRTELTEVSGTGIDVLPNLPSVRYRYPYRTELTEVSGTGMKVYILVPAVPV